MNKVYLYDGTFSSLVALIMCLINVDNVCIKDYSYQKNLFDECINLSFKDKERIILDFKKRLGMQIYKTVYYVYLSNDCEKENIIYKFVKEALKYKLKVYYYRNLESVNETIKLSNMVLHEAHKMKGFLRFKQMKNNFYFAEFEPTHNIISILANHFKTRLSNENFVIHDIKRKIYAVYDKKRLYYLHDSDISSFNLDENIEEEKMSMLWKTFFDTIAIEQRKNPKCQMNFMPKKYWQYITEMEDRK